ncbi:hypothetical protein LSCM1_08256 [Leishmania martiniquensis]|uniref:Putative tRNA (cytidine(32)/guanosine(34)-2'-O)-methyltransferase n=1 Tax=Leishmania martiniquensis TaxID=1580590 RepID=A0A836KUX1_9TRYP|nr:hypothetical protein LSCM1_08256 [Leishmania martiniquensis]
MGRASKDKRDIYYRKAKEEGYRARSAYKLLQIHEEFNILDPAQIRTGAVDLCAAPGSWSQVLAQHFKRIGANAAAAAAPPPPPPRVVAVDLQEMAPIDGVTILQGDITAEGTAQEIVRLLNASESSGVRSLDDEQQQPASGPSTSPPSPPLPTGPLRKADIVVCDGAPDVTGMHELDEYLQHHLLLAALHITTLVLRAGGCFLTKMFRGPNTAFLVAKSEIFFAQVRVVKPKSSRNASMESFLLCQGFQMPPGYVPRLLDAAAPEDGEGVRGGCGEGSAVRGGPLRASGFTPEAPSYCYETNAPTPPPASAAGAAAAQDITRDGKRTTCALASKVLAPFLSCGDLWGFDADMCYDRDEEADVLLPVQPPLQAPYLTAAAFTSLPPSATLADECETQAGRGGSQKKKTRVEALTTGTIDRGNHSDGAEQQ